MDKQKHILITGASSGIGLELTKKLAEKGFFIIAGARTSSGLDILSKLNSQNVLPILIDVTKQEEVKQQFKQLDPILSKHGLLGLINNAGIAIPGPVEYISSVQFNQQLQVNVVGALTMTQAGLPYLRKSQGKIINIGSVSGRLTGALLGGYSASKFALRALSQAMLLELQSCNIAVTYIEAGNINTPIWQKGIDFIQNMDCNDNSLNTHYGKQLKALVESSQKMKRDANSTHEITSVILKCLMTDKPKSFYLVGKDAKILYWLSKVISSEKISLIINYFLNKRA
jgi:short-subunit dehydrogenase